MHEVRGGLGGKRECPFMLPEWRRTSWTQRESSYHSRPRLPPASSGRSLSALLVARVECCYETASRFATTPSPRVCRWDEVFQCRVCSDQTSGPGPVPARYGCCCLQSAKRSLAREQMQRKKRFKYFSITFEYTNVCTIEHERRCPIVPAWGPPA